MSEQEEASEPNVPPKQISLIWRRTVEHRVVQWGVSYVALAYAIQHAVSLTIESLDWPHELERASMILLALGVPMVVTLAWYHGDRVSRRVSGPELTIIAVLLAMSSLLFFKFVQPKEGTANRTAASHERSATIASATMPRNSVAVLPFLNLSGDPKQDFFSDGMTEEVTSALAKIPRLPVIGRTSAFQFRGRTGDLRAIGRALNAAYVLEGSVRRADDRVRVTAQLVSTDTGDHIWTENYDRQLKDIFGVQEDVAQAIAGALQIPLGLKQGENLVSDRTADTDSYQNYLRARALFRARDMAQTIPLLESTVARDPNYAPAWAMLARAYIPYSGSLHPPYRGSVEEASDFYREYAKKESHAARQALRLDPRNAAAHAALGQLSVYQGDWITAQNEFNQSLALDPNDPDTLAQYASAFLGQAGYTKQEFTIRQKLRSLEPFVPVYNREMAGTLLNLGQTNAALDTIQRVPSDTPGRQSVLIAALSFAGRFAEAADQLERSSLPAGNSETEKRTAARLLRSAPQPVATSVNLPDLRGLNFVYLFVGAPERALADAEREIAVKGAPRPNFSHIWSPYLAPARHTARFKSLVRNAGLVNFWRAHGWPDLCHPVGTSDFACN